MDGRGLAFVADLLYQPTDIIQPRSIIWIVALKRKETPDHEATRTLT
jgi:hypothetical protein